MQSATVSINTHEVRIEWTPAAARELEPRMAPLIVEQELDFSRGMKKVVRFRDN